MGVAISGLTAATTIAEADVFEIEQSTVSKKITKTQLRKLLYSDPAFSVALPQTGDSLTYNGTDWVAGARGGWRTIHQQAYTESPPLPSSSKITFAGGSASGGINLNGGDYFAVGSPVRVVIGGLTYYGICTAITNTELTMSGMIMPTGTEITSLAVGTQEMVRHHTMVAPAAYNVLSVNVTQMRWRGPTGYLVAFSCAHRNTSSTTVVNLRMNAGSNVSTAGITVAAGGATTYGAFTDSALGDIIAANAAISDKQTVAAVVSSTSGTGDYLLVDMTFIVP